MIITTFRRGIVTQVSNGFGIIRGLTSWGAMEGLDIEFYFEAVRFLDVDTTRRELSFGQRQQPLHNGVTLMSFRDPVVGDIVMYDHEWLPNGRVGGVLWTYEVHYKECEDKLPRCTVKECSNAPRLGKLCCTFHAPREDDYDEDDDYVSMGTVLSRAQAHFGNTEQARDAARDFPGDFI
jgi:hypothetical protein